MAMTYVYGAAPHEFVSGWRPNWTEYMHYLYLPVMMPDHDGVRLPENVAFAEGLVRDVAHAEGIEINSPDRYIYLTARRGYASPGSPLNRPGWHADGFGSDDLNYIWSDAYPTRFAIGEFVDISTDHILSALQFEQQVEMGQRRAAHPDGLDVAVGVVDGRPHAVYRLDPSVVHATPIIPPPGGNRSFLKLSVSPNMYNLEGNSHNYRFDYDWKMWSRDEVRNDPAYSGGDAGPQEA
jgi:hypothetical protein